MNWYKDYRSQWKEIIETVAAEEHRTTQMVEITPELDSLIDRVRDDRMKSKNNPSAQLKYNINEMLKEIIASRFYESDYNNITKKLLYEEMSYNDAISRGIVIVADMDIFEYKR